MNTFQQALVKTYANGDFAHVTSTEEASGVGDSLFYFLFVELSDGEDCSHLVTAINRLDQAIADISIVRDAINEG